MKKIKYLLLWIVSLLWIGVSFWTTTPFYFDYFTTDWWINSYNLDNNQTFFPCIYKYYSVQYVTDLQYYSQSCNSSFNSNFLWFNVYYDSNWNRLSYRLNAGSNSRPWYLFVLASNLATENISNVWNGAYSRILAWPECLNSDIFQSWNFCVPNFVQLFTNKYYTISSLWNIYDSDYNWVHYYKWPVTPAVWLWYSFGFVTWEGRQNSWNHYYLNTWNWDFFTFRSVSFSWSQFSSFEGVLLMRLNNTLFNNTWNSYKLFALGVTWNISDYSFIYSIYNCPSTAWKYYDCVFSEGWNISENFSYDFESSNPYSNLIYLLTKSWPVKLNNSYSSANNQITLSSQDWTSYYVPTYSITLNLVPTTWIDIIWWTPVDTWHLWNADNQIAKSLRLMCQWPVYNTSDWLPPAICLNVDWTLKTKEQLDNCYVVTTVNSTDNVTSEFYCSNWNFLEQMQLVQDWSWLYLTPCSSWICVYNNLLPSDNWTWYNSDYFENFLNTTWYLWKCPRTYDNNVVIWSSLITLLNWSDVMKPVNCMLAWFMHWRRSLEFWSGWRLIPDWPLLNFESDNWKSLYNFFDILLSFWIIIFSWKIFYLFHK